MVDGSLFHSSLHTKTRLKGSTRFHGKCNVYGLKALP